VSRDFELGPNLSGLSKIAYLFIASGNLGMFERQMGVASVGVTAPVLLADCVTTGNGLKNGVHCGL